MGTVQKNYQPEIGELVFWEVPTVTTTMYMCALFLKQLESGNSLVKVYQKDHQRFLERDSMEVNKEFILKPITKLPQHIKSIL